MKKDLTEEEISCIHEQITKKVMKDYDLFSKKFIDYGYCWVWALEFSQKTGGEICNVKDYGGHSFVKIGNKFFDANTIGITRWHGLKCLVSEKLTYQNRNRIYIHSVKQHIRYWKKHGIDTVFQQWQKINGKSKYNKK